MIDVEFENVDGSFGLNSYPSANAALSVTTSDAAFTFTPSVIFDVAWGSPEVTAVGEELHYRDPLQ